MAELPEGVGKRAYKLFLELGLLGDCLRLLTEAQRGERPLWDLRSYLSRYPVLGPERELKEWLGATVEESVPPPKELSLAEETLDQLGLKKSKKDARYISPLEQLQEQAARIEREVLDRIRAAGDERRAALDEWGAALDEWRAHPEEHTAAAKALAQPVWGAYQDRYEELRATESGVEKARAYILSTAQDRYEELRATESGVEKARAYVLSSGRYEVPVNLIGLIDSPHRGAALGMSEAIRYWQKRGERFGDVAGERRHRFHTHLKQGFEEGARADIVDLLELRFLLAVGEFDDDWPACQALTAWVEKCFANRSPGHYPGYFLGWLLSGEERLCILMRELVEQFLEQIVAGRREEEEGVWFSPRPELPGPEIAETAFACLSLLRMGQYEGHIELARCAARWLTTQKHEEEGYWRGAEGHMQPTMHQEVGKSVMCTALCAQALIEAGVYEFKWQLEPTRRWLLEQQELLGHWHIQGMEDEFATVLVLEALEAIDALKEGEPPETGEIVKKKPDVLRYVLYSPAEREGKRIAQSQYERLCDRAARGEYDLLIDLTQNPCRVWSRISTNLTQGEPIPLPIKEGQLLAEYVKRHLSGKPAIQPFRTETYKEQTWSRDTAARYFRHAVKQVDPAHTWFRIHTRFPEGQCRYHFKPDSDNYLVIELPPSEPNEK